MLVFIDFETGGLKEDSPNIQLAAVAVDAQFKELSFFQSKISFDETKADPEALKMNGYNPSTWRTEGKPEAVVVGVFDAWLQNFKCIDMVSKKTGNPYKIARLAGHNVCTFDMPRLKRAYGSRFMAAHPIPLDTLQLALWHWQGCADAPPNFQLTTLMGKIGVDAQGAHDALADARFSAMLAKYLISNR